jgi:CheY-like chemotaxis protein
MATILIVEDNELNRDMLYRRLVRMGLAVITASDGEQAVQTVKANRPDLVLMDLDLPVLDGWTATKLIKQDRDLKHIPVIALTAHAMTPDREKALDAGCDDYDTKPIDLPRLMGKMRKLLNGVSERARPAA